MDESSGKSEFSIRLTFGGRNINLMRTFQASFVIRAEWSKSVHAHHRRAQWKVRLHALLWVKDEGWYVSVSGQDTVEYKCYCHQGLHGVPREFHSSKLHYLRQTWRHCVGMRGGTRRLSAPSGRYYSTAGCRDGSPWFLLYLAIWYSPLLISFQRSQTRTCESSSCLLRV